MEKVVEIDLWSDDWAGNNIINVLHDVGIKTAGMHTVINGTFEEKVEWSRCKSGEIPSICVCLKGDAMKSIAENVHATKDVEEKPLFLYRLTVIDDVPDTVEEDTEDTEEEEREETVTLNIGCTTKDGEMMDADEMINLIGYYHDCTITKTIGFYKGVRENSLKVEIYGVSISTYASFWARCFKQECVALTIKDTTVFIKGIMSDDEHDTMVRKLTK